MHVFNSCFCFEINRLQKKLFSKNELALCVHPSYKQIQSVKKKKKISTPVPGELPQEAYTQVRQDLLLKVTYFMLATEKGS